MNTRYFLTGIISDHLHLVPEEGKWIEEIKQLAITHQIDIVAGSIVEREVTEEQSLKTVENESKTLYNTYEHFGYFNPRLETRCG